MQYDPLYLFQANGLRNWIFWKSEGVSKTELMVGPYTMYLWRYFSVTIFCFCFLKDESQEIYEAS